MSRIFLNLHGLELRIARSDDNSQCFQAEGYSPIRLFHRLLAAHYLSGLVLQGRCAIPLSERQLHPRCSLHGRDAMHAHAQASRLFQAFNYILLDLTNSPCKVLIGTSTDRPDHAPNSNEPPPLRTLANRRIFDA